MRPQVLPPPPRRWRPKRRPRRTLPFRIPFLPFLRSDMPPSEEPLEEDRDDLDDFEEDGDTSDDVEDTDEPEDRRSPLRWRWGRPPPRGTSSRSELRLGMVVSFNRCLKRSYGRSCDEVINGILNGSGAKCEN